MSKIVINRNFDKNYIYRYLQHSFKPTTDSMETGVSLVSSNTELVDNVTGFPELHNTSARGYILTYNDVFGACTEADPKNYSPTGQNTNLLNFVFCSENFLDILDYINQAFNDGILDKKLLSLDYDRTKITNLSKEILINTLICTNKTQRYSALKYLTYHKVIPESFFCIKELETVKEFNEITFTEKVIYPREARIGFEDVTYIPPAESFVYKGAYSLEQYNRVYTDMFQYEEDIGSGSTYYNCFNLNSTKSHHIKCDIPEGSILYTRSFESRYTYNDKYNIGIIDNVLETPDYYLSPTGSDTTGNGTRENPWESASRVPNYKTVMLLNGTYTNVTIGYSNIKVLKCIDVENKYDLVIIGESQNGVVLQEPTYDYDVQYQNHLMVGGNNITLKNVTVNRVKNMRITTTVDNSDPENPITTINEYAPSWTYCTLAYRTSAEMVFDSVKFNFSDDSYYATHYQTQSGEIYFYNCSFNGGTDLNPNIYNAWHFDFTRPRDVTAELSIDTPNRDYYTYYKTTNPMPAGTYVFTIPSGNRIDTHWHFMLPTGETKISANMNITHADTSYLTEVKLKTTNLSGNLYIDGVEQVMEVNDGTETTFKAHRNFFTNSEIILEGSADKVEIARVQNDNYTVTNRNTLMDDYLDQFTIDYYISPDGEDYNEGTKESPWRTSIQVPKGSTVMLLDGIYEETWRYNTSYYLLKCFEGLDMTNNVDNNITYVGESKQGVRLVRDKATMGGEYGAIFYNQDRVKLINVTVVQANFYQHWQYSQYFAIDVACEYNEYHNIDFFTENYFTWSNATNDRRKPAFYSCFLYTQHATNYYDQGGNRFTFPESYYNHKKEVYTKLKDAVIDKKLEFFSTNSYTINDTEFIVNGDDTYSFRHTKPIKLDNAYREIDHEANLDIDGNIISKDIYLAFFKNGASALTGFGVHPDVKDNVYLIDTNDNTDKATLVDSLHSTWDLSISECYDYDKKVLIPQFTYHAAKITEPGLGGDIIYDHTDRIDYIDGFDLKFEVPREIKKG